MNLIKKLESQTPTFVNLQEVDEEAILSCIAAKSRRGNLFVRIVLKDNSYSIAFLAKSQECLFEEGDEVIPSGITSNGVVLWAKRPKKRKK